MNFAWARFTSPSLAAFKDFFGALSFLGILILTWFAGVAYWDERYYVAEEGLGYWMGIIGGLLMLFAMTYSVAKRRMTGPAAAMIRSWFKLHLFAGIMGPVIILFHTTFQLGSVNGMIAFYATAAVFISGLIGRYIYSGLNRITDRDNLVLFKKMMGMWRHMHVPLLYILFISGVLHVIAVHLY